MIKKLLPVFVVLFTATSLALAAEKIKLPDYKKWPVFKSEYTYQTAENKCQNFQNYEEVGRKGLVRAIRLTMYQYRDPDSYDFLDLIENTDGKPWLIFYKTYLFQRERRFLFFGYKWKHIDTFPQREENSKFRKWADEIGAFHLRNCLFFMTQ